MLGALIKELELKKNKVNDAIDTVYFGGGTPSILDEAELSALFMAITTQFTINPEAEVTLEANPDDLDLAKLKMLKRIGVNRLSIGIQSFNNEDLIFTNRAHNVQMAIQCVQDARQVGFDNISIDLMYGLPNMDLAGWELNLQKVIELNPEHISAYCLTIEPKTVFGNWEKSNKLKAADEEQTATQFELMIERLNAAGYEQYEVSNFSRDGHYSKHNSSYWLQKTYVGIGPGAHSFYQDKRAYNIANNAKYIASLEMGIVPETTEVLSTNQRISEYLLTGLRTNRGCDLDYLTHELGYAITTKKGELLSKYVAHNLLVIEEKNLKLTTKGRLLADEITVNLMPD